MAQRIEIPTVTVPAGTAIAAPQTTNFDWLPGEVQRIEVIVPPGPSGLMGFAIGHSGQVILPFTSGQYAIADDHHFDWYLEDFPIGNKWFCRAYNTDIYPHTLYFFVHLRELSTVVSNVVPIIPVVPVIPQVVTE